LRRTASTPASISSRSFSCVEVAGPMVATIFVLRRSADIAPSVAMDRPGERPKIVLGDDDAPVAPP
jgi:hypothetical protein